MTRPKRIGVWLVGIAALFSILFFSLNSILSRTTLPAELKETLLAKLCEESACQADFEKLEILLLPTPHAVASNVRITLPGRLSGTLESLSLFPKIVPLFTGHIVLARVRLISPKMAITIPEVSPARDPNVTPLADLQVGFSDANASAQHSGNSSQGSTPNHDRQAQPSSFSQLEAAAHALLTALADKAPGLHLQIEHGKIDFSNATTRLISLQELSAAISLPPNLLRVKLECESDHWKKLAIDGWLNPGERAFKARMVLHQLRAQRLAAYLPSSKPRPMDESPLDLELSISSEAPEIVSATFEGSSPSLTLQMGDEKSLITNLSFKGALQKTSDELQVKVARLSIEDPQLSLTGQFLTDSKIPESSYHLECLHTNATAVREVALALVGESQVVQDIFEIVRGGTVPKAIFEARGSSTKDLQDSEHLTVDGSLQNGEVFIPKVNLRVDDVFGEVHISHGILEGKNLQGRTGASTGYNGSLTVALAEEDGPFHLDIEIDADLAQLPPVLTRVVDSEAFLKELAKVKGVSGRAKGKLILGDTLKKVQARVEVNDWNLKGLYQRFPFPLELAASSFLYDGPTIAIRSLRGSLGESQLFDVSGSLDWSRGPYLELASSSAARISLDEFFPWLMTQPGTEENPWNIQSMGGTLWVDSLEFKGLLSRPEDWHFLGNCRVEELTCRTPSLPDTLRIKTGAILATPKSLKAKNCNATCLDASLVVSGKFTGSMKDLRAAEVAFRGDIGPQAGLLASDLLHLPPDLRVRAPLTTPQTRLNWAQKAPTSLSSTFTVSGGPEVTINLDQSARRLSLNQLSISDQESNATITINIGEDEFGFGFRGNLTAATLDRLFTNNQLLGGSLVGDLSARVIRNQLATSSAEGQLTVKDLWFAPKQGARLALQDASLMAKGKSLEVRTATFRVMDTPMDLKGSLGVTDNQVQLDLDLRADEIDWNKLKEVYPLLSKGDQKPEKANKGGESFQEMPIRGNLRIDAGRFNYNHYEWKPLRANLLFAQDGINVQVMEAKLCTIPTPATIIPSNLGPLLVIKLDARNLDLDPTISCLWDRKGIITGAFNLEGEVTAKIQQQNLNEVLQGGLKLVAWNGRVYRSTVLAKIFDLLNFTEIYRGRLPDLAHEGCAYDSFRARAALKNGQLIVEDAIFDGRCAKMVGTGTIDLESQKVNFTVLVSPLKTVDTVIRHIPLVGNLLGGSLVSIPVRVGGDLSNPSVIPLSPSAVGSGLLGTMKRVFQLPFTLTQPLQ
jgi:hypothetical protein